MPGGGSTTLARELEEIKLCDNVSMATDNICYHVVRVSIDPPLSEGSEGRQDPLGNPPTSAPETGELEEAACVGILEDEHLGTLPS